VIALATAVARAIPPLLTSARGRAHQHDAPTAFRIRALATPPAWQEGVELLFTDEQRRHTGHARLLRSTWAAAIVAVVLLGYLVIALVEGFPWWSWALTVVLLALLAGWLWRAWSVWHNIHPDGHRAPSGTVLVAGEPDDVLQFALFALRAIGARLVDLREGQLVAGTGIALGGLWIGNRVHVTVQPGEAGVRVTVRSSKLDYVTRNTTTRDVTRFLELWADPPRIVPDPGPDPTGGAGDRN
jgi:hypothetical protein